ncbi:cytochrome P450 [Periconia macrospinosa]|uniref:Cytochrome P450 n=1 Tax=Periconia macrospinosa TaxID=97972 RepID=A0A2V1EB69_9PLEO|nr:cytochrome P450 [Periconia macrospinosa]
MSNFSGTILGNDVLSRVINLMIIGLLVRSPLAYYRLRIQPFFHPLAKFPGPVLWRASRLPYMRAAWGKHFPYVVQKLHAQYGEVIRVAPNELSFSGPAAWDDIYSNTEGANNGAFPKSEIWHGNPDGGPASVFTTINFKEHARIRRFMDPAFSERAVLKQEPILQEYVGLCINKLRERASTNDGKTTVNIVDWFNFTLFDIVGELSFGESFDCLKKCEYEGWMDQMAASMKLHYLSINLRHYPIITALTKLLGPFLVPKDIVAQHMDYSQRSAEKLKRRLASKDSIDRRPDIISQLMRSEDRDEGLTSQEVLLNSMLFINAASETTATTLTGVVNMLLQNPASLAKLETEIRDFSNQSDLTLEALKRLPYLNAVLQEALRMCNPNPIGHLRTTPPNGGIVDGHFVAGNTLVTIQPQALCYSSKYFHEPEAWRPERWLKDAETNPESPYYYGHRKGVRGFGWGPYICVGEPLGWAWMRLIIASMVWTFDLRKANAPNSLIDWAAQDVFGIVIKHPLNVTFQERTT